MLPCTIWRFHHPLACTTRMLPLPDRSPIASLTALSRTRLSRHLETQHESSQDRTSQYLATTFRQPPCLKQKQPLETHTKEVWKIEGRAINTNVHLVRSPHRPRHQRRHC